MTIRSASRCRPRRLLVDCVFPRAALILRRLALLLMLAAGASQAAAPTSIRVVLDDN